eukprot:3335_1
MFNMIVINILNNIKKHNKSSNYNSNKEIKNNICDEIFEDKYICDLFLFAISLISSNDYAIKICSESLVFVDNRLPNNIALNTITRTNGVLNSSYASFIEFGCNAHETQIYFNGTDDHAEDNLYIRALFNATISIEKWIFDFLNGNGKKKK